jgi:hypothetical protein
VSDANVVKLLQPRSFADPLTEVLRNGARSLLAQAIEAEVAEFLAKHVDLTTATGLRRVVRHGHLPEREVMTGIGRTALAMVFKLVDAAQKSWHRLDGHNVSPPPHPFRFGRRIGPCAQAFAAELPVQRRRSALKTTETVLALAAVSKAVSLPAPKMRSAVRQKELCRSAGGSRAPTADALISLIVWRAHTIS